MTQPRRQFKIDWARTAIVLMIFDLLFAFTQLSNSERVRNEDLRVLVVSIICARTLLMFILTGVCVTYIRSNERRQ